MSNPVMNQDRKTLASMIEDRGFAMRQDLHTLQTLAASADRSYFSHLGEPSDEIFKAVLHDEVKVDPAGQVDTSYLRVVSDGCPISKLQHDGEQIHPPTSNKVGGKVSVKRNFGSRPSKDATLLRALVAAYPDKEYLCEVNQKVVYTSGTPKGFSTRLRELTTRKCVGEGSATTIAKKLEKLLPTGALPDWHDIAGLFEIMHTTQSAGAGAPYWVSKAEAALPMMETILPLVIKALEAGEITQFMKENPELFLSEVKNKTDRYETAKLDDKVRPYVSQPFHFSALFSAILQPFCGSLKTWDSQESTMNAYGWSMANGGIERIYQRVAHLQERTSEDRKIRFKIGLYGDDAKLFFINRDAEVYAVDPDFRQMDGSVDRHTVEGVAKWISRAYTEQHGESPFWDNVLKLMVEFATDPTFVVNGTTVYKKPQKDGILSGVVGTTLFDTAKSALAYSHLLDEFKIEPKLFHDAKRVTKFLKDKHGLVVKEGTWTPEKLSMEPEHGELWTKNKFLGMSFMWYHDDQVGAPTLVPYLSDDDWVNMILHPRESITGKKLGDLAKQRISFDRARGYLITGAAFNPQIADLLYKAIDLVPATAILMAVAAGGGKGESPGEHQIVGDSFLFPSSEGVPSVSWCAQLYAGVENKTGWQLVYPTIDAKLQNTRTSWKSRLRNSVKEISYAPLASEIPSVLQAVFEPPPQVEVAAATNFSKRFVNRVDIVLAPTQKADKLQPVAEYLQAVVSKTGPMMEAQLASKIGRPVPKELKRVTFDAPTLRSVVVDTPPSLVSKSHVSAKVLLALKTFPMTKPYPTIEWLNILASVSQRKLVVKTTVTDTLTNYKRVAFFLNEEVDKHVLGFIEGLQPAKDLKQMFVERVYGMCYALHEHGVKIFQVIGKKDPEAKIYKMPVVMHPEETQEFDAILKNLTASAHGDTWAFIADADAREIQPDTTDAEIREISNQLEYAKRLVGNLQTTLEKLIERKYGKQQQKESGSKAKDAPKRPQKAKQQQQQQQPKLGRA